MQRALSLNNSPHPSVPLPFMFSAPVFVLLASLLLLWAGPRALAVRWTPEALALTHLFTLGALAHTMAGGIMQILPVATGIHVLSPRLSAAVVHICLSCGTLLLASAFLTGQPWQFAAALSLLGIGLAWLLVSCAGGLWRDRRKASKGSTEILAGTRLALASLLLAISLGTMLAAYLALSRPPARQFTDMHGAWGLLGWVGLLIVAMSYQLIPMFQVTELYPRPLTRWLAPGIFGLLLLLTLALLPPASPALRLACGLALCAAFLVYAGSTLKLLKGRKRPEPDTTTLFWRTGLSSLILCIAAWLWHAQTANDMSVLIGVLYIAGFAWSVINGMLYKIIPFLIWFHCQRSVAAPYPFIPKVKHVITDRQARLQFRAHLIALFLLVAACVWPALVRVAGVALGISSLWLLILMAAALRKLVITRRRIEALERAPGETHLHP